MLSSQNKKIALKKINTAGKVGHSAAYVCQNIPSQETEVTFKRFS